LQILVSGSRGFIGSHLVSALKAKGYYVRGIDIKRDCYLKTGEDEFVLGDLRKPEVALAVTKGMDYIYHTAANMGGIQWISEVGADIILDQALKFLDPDSLHQPARFEDCKHLGLFAAIKTRFAEGNAHSDLWW
jgi:nucleoside-diphosphate-sugar epimerase